MIVVSPSSELDSPATADAKGTSPISKSEPLTCRCNARQMLDVITQNLERELCGTPEYKLPNIKCFYVGSYFSTENDCLTINVFL